VDLLRIRKSRPHIHEGLECIFVVSGNINLDLDGTHYRMNPDDIAVINPNQLHTVHGNSSALILALYVEKDYLLKECPEMTGCSICCNSADTNATDGQRYTELKKTLIQLKLIDIEKSYGYELNMRILFLRLIYILLINFRVDQTAGDFGESLENAPELSDVLQYMHQNYYSPISLKDMADLAFMSPHYFSKYFKRKTGESFFHYLQKIRMESAMKSLIYGNDTILRIALDNGFANPKAFSSTFAKQYNDTPSAYRKRCRNIKVYESYRDSIENAEKIEGDITELLRYGKKYDLTYEHGKPAKEVLAVDMQSGVKRFIRGQKIFLNIGRIDAALRSGFISDLKNKLDLGMQYVYFSLWYKESGSKITKDMLSSSWNYHILQAIDIFHAIGLVPVFKISCEAPELPPESPHVRESVIVGKLLEAITGHYPRQYSEKWMFEICPGNVPPAQAVSLYREMRSVIKRELPLSPVGLFSVSDDKRESMEMFSQRLSLADSKGCRPDFISFSVFANSLKADHLPDIMHYPVKGYHKRVGMAVKSVCKNLGCSSLPMYMIDWNTMTGSNQSEMTVYFRSSLIFQTLMELNEIIEGAGFWYDTVDSSFLSDEAYSASLALYAYNGVRRPAYFVLETFMRLGSKVLWETDNAVATYRDDEAEWVILIWNSSYLNPFYCTSKSFLDEESKTVDLELKGLDSGKYQFKKFIIDRDFSGSLSQHISSGFPNYNDKDAYDHLQMAVGRQMIVFEEDISRSEAYILSSDIGMNGLLMLVIKKIG